MKTCISVLLVLATPMICRGSTTAPTTAPQYHVLKKVDRLFAIYDVSDKANEESTGFLDDILAALAMIEENPIGKKAVTELASKTQKVVIIPTDFLFRMQMAVRQDAGDLEKYKEALETLEFLGKIDAINIDQVGSKKEQCQTIGEVENILKNAREKRWEFGQTMFELESAIAKDLRESCQKFTEEKEDIFGNERILVVLDRLVNVFKQGSCFVEPTDTYPINLIAIDRNWRNNKKLMMDKGAFLAQQNWVQIKPAVDPSVAATLFHEINHCRHYYKFGKVKYKELNQLSNATGSSSLQILKDRGENPLLGIFTNAKEELQLTGFTIDNNKSFIYDGVNELNFRLNGPFHIRFPYAKPDNHGGLYLSADECRKLIKPVG